MSTQYWHWPLLPINKNRWFTEDVSKDISCDVVKWFDTSNHDERKRPLPIRKNKKVMGLMKDEKGGKITAKSVAAGPKLYSYCLQKGGHKIAEWSESLNWTLEWYGYCLWKYCGIKSN